MALAPSYTVFLTVLGSRSTGPGCSGDEVEVSDSLFFPTNASSVVDASEDPGRRVVGNRDCSLLAPMAILLLLLLEMSIADTIPLLVRPDLLLQGTHLHPKVRHL